MEDRGFPEAYHRWEWFRRPQWWPSFRDRMLSLRGRDRDDMQELQPSAYGSVRELFEAPHTRFAFEGVVAGNSPGRIWVDDAAPPRSALLWEGGPRFHLGGDAGSAAFNAEAAGLIETRLRPVEEARGPSFLVACASDAWEDGLSALFGGRHLERWPRLLYHLGALRVAGWQERLPSGFTVVRIHGALLSSEGLANVGRLIHEIESCWTSRCAFLCKGFGYCALRGDEVVSWCTAEYVHGSHCGIGIETVAECQGQGLATATASAFLEHCARHRIEPHWDCWANNAASVRVAEKVGFTEPLHYHVHGGSWA